MGDANGGLGAALTDLDAMNSRLVTRFTVDPGFDSRGRILVNRRLSGAAAPPRFLLGRTRHGNTWRFRSDLNSSVVSALARYAGRESPLDSSLVCPERLPALLRVLNPSERLRDRWDPDTPTEHLFRWAVFRPSGSAPMSLATAHQRAGLLDMPWSDRPRPSEASRLGLVLLGDIFDFF